MYRKNILLVFIFCLGCLVLSAQKDIMLQTFYWDVPVDGSNKKGLWWNNLHEKADDFRDLGITSLWIPAPSKGNWGIYDMGYGVYDHYDLGNYDQKGSVETRFGSRKELEAMVAAMHDTTGGRMPVQVYADIILNHMYASDENAQANPAVKQYVFDEAVRHGKQAVPYPTNEITWIIPQARKGEYLIRIKGYSLDLERPEYAQGYEIQIDYTKDVAPEDHRWSTGAPKGEIMDFPGSGQKVRSLIFGEDDFNTYRIMTPGDTDIVIRLTAMKKRDKQWHWTHQTNGYYPFEVLFQGQDLADQYLEAHTNTHFFYPERTCETEPHYEWNYSHFHPADENGWLGDWGDGSEVIPNTKAYGNDLNTFDPVVQQRLMDWGVWLVDQISFDGFRLDFVWGYQEEFAAAWINNLPQKNGSQRFIVSEYWGPASRIHAWKNKVRQYGAQTSVFDFPLKFTLTQMCNGDEDFDMQQLRHAGLIRNAEGYHLPASSVVTFLENHDTGKEHDKWVTKDWHLGYAYILTHQGLPCLFYPHLYGVTLKDMLNHDLQAPVPSELVEEIRKLVFIRQTYLDGELEVLSQENKAQPAENLKNVYVARRQGNHPRSGALVVINNSHDTNGLWVDVNTPGFDDWRAKKLVNALDIQDQVHINSQGKVWVEAPARGYAIYVPQPDYVPFTSR